MGYNGIENVREIENNILNFDTLIEESGTRVLWSDILLIKFFFFVKR